MNEFRKPKKISKLTYNIFLNKFSANISETNQQDKWQRDLQNNLNDSLIWKSRFTLLYKSSIDNKMRNFQFKLIHRKIAPQSFLYKIGISTSSSCTFCENHEQTLSHLFVNCEKVRSFWNVICAWLKEKNIRNILFTDEEYFVGTLIINNFYLVNTVIIFAKYFIFTCKMQNVIPLFPSFQRALKHLENMERIIAFKKNRLDLHKKKWQIFC